MLQQQLCPKSPGPAGTRQLWVQQLGRRDGDARCFIWRSALSFAVWTSEPLGSEAWALGMPSLHSPIDTGTVTVVVATKSVHQVQTNRMLPTCTIPQIPAMDQFGAAWSEMPARIFHLGQSKPFLQFPCSTIPKVQAGMLIALVCVSSLLAHGHIQNFCNLSRKKKTCHSKRILPPWNPWAKKGQHFLTSHSRHL